MISLLRLSFFLILLALGAPGSPAAAETPQPNQTQEQFGATVQHLSDKLADVEKRMDANRPTQAELIALGGEVAPLIAEAQSLVERLTPRVSAVKARLDQLGPTPATGENGDITQERQTLEKAFADNDGLFKRAKVLALKAQQYGSYVAKRQRSLFTHSLFQRSRSLLDPPLWISVVRETPGNLADIGSAFTQWLDDFNRDLSGGRLVAFWAIVGLVIVLYWPLTWAARRVRSHDARVEDPSRRQEVLDALWVSVSVAGTMIAVIAGVAYVFSFASPPEPRLVPLFSALQMGVIRVALAAGLARGLLAPGRSKWRLVNLDDTTADKLVRIAIAVAVVVSASRIIEALNDVIYASLEFSIAARGIGALLIAAGLAAALIDLGDNPEADNPHADAPASRALAGGPPDVATVSPTQRRDIYGFVRALAWTLILVIVGAVAVGYIAFASFLVEQMTLVAAVGTVLYLLVQLLDESCAYGLQPTSWLGRNLVYTVGLRRETLEQMPVVLSGIGRLLLFGIALLVVAAPWGMQSSDWSSNLLAIFFGFKIGDITVSLAGIAEAIISFLAVLGFTRSFQGWLEDRYLPTTRLDAGLRNSIRTSLGYVGFLIALILSAGMLGLDFQKLAIVAGALSVGIGFGLQSVVNNFVSGLILLWERAVRVGDWVVVGSDQGYVRKINVRSTEIETFDRAAVIVPNSNLVSGVVKNLMRADRVGRITIELTVHATADPEKVREVLLAICAENEAVLTLPVPAVRFINLTASAMTFDLFCFIADVEAGMRVKSDLYFAICRQFRQFGFFDGPPPDPTAVNILGLDRLGDLLKADVRRGEAEPRARKTG